MSGARPTGPGCAVDELRLPPGLAGLGSLAGFVAKLADAAGLGEALAYRLRLAADELVTNAVCHGRAQRPIQVCGGIDGDRVWLRIRDEGRRFDPRAHVGRPLAPAASGTRDGDPVGGFGIFLAMRSVDEFDYKYIDGTNQCTLTVYRD